MPQEDCFWKWKCSLFLTAFVQICCFHEQLREWRFLKLQSWVARFTYPCGFQNPPAEGLSLFVVFWFPGLRGDHELGAAHAKPGGHQTVPGKHKQVGHEFQFSLRSLRPIRYDFRYGIRVDPSVWTPHIFNEANATIGGGSSRDVFSPNVHTSMSLIFCECCLLRPLMFATSEIAILSTVDQLVPDMHLIVLLTLFFEKLIAWVCITRMVEISMPL